MEHPCECHPRSMGHTFDATLVCRRDGCSCTWGEHLGGQHACEGGVCKQGGTVVTTHQMDEALKLWCLYHQKYKSKRTIKDVGYEIGMTAGESYNAFERARRHVTRHGEQEVA